MSDPANRFKQHLNRACRFPGHAAFLPVTLRPQREGQPLGGKTNSFGAEHAGLV